MIVDIFTHENAPEKPNVLDGVCDSLFHYDEQNGIYLERIKQRATESDLAVWLPLSDNEGWLQNIIPDSQRLSCYRIGNGVYGCVDKEHKQKYFELLGNVRPTDEIRIHGAFFGICLSETAVQVYYLLQNHFLHPTDIDYANQYMEVREGNVLMATKISYGIVYMPPRSLSPDELLFARQLVREHTVVFDFR